MHSSFQGLYKFRVVKARHFYDMNVVKDQNKHIKDKYVITNPVRNVLIEFILILGSVSGMPAGSFSVCIAMSSLSPVKTSFNYAKDILSGTRKSGIRIQHSPQASKECVFSAVIRFLSPGIQMA